MTTTADILRAAKERISDPVRWTKGANARKASGVETHLGTSEAVCWCTIGALDSASWNNVDAINKLAAQLPSGFRWLHVFNDHLDTKHSDVMALFDRAIAAEEGRG